MNVFPPLLLSRIQVTEVGSGFRRCTVRVKPSLLTRNLNGSIFGGTIFSAADPLYAVMYWQIFARRGERVEAWLKSARIQYLRPASSALFLEFALTDEEVEQAAAELEQRGRFVRTHRTEAVDRAGRICAVVETEVYVRRPRPENEGVSAF